MNREIKTLLMDLAARRSSLALVFGIWGTILGAQMLGEDPLSYGALAVFAAWLFVKTALDGPAVRRVYGQLPVAAASPSRAGILFMWILGALLVLAIGPMARIGRSIGWLQAEPDPRRLALLAACTVFAAICMVCASLLARIALHAVAARPAMAIGARIGDRAVDILRYLCAAALFFEIGISLAEHSEPGMTEAIFLAASAALLSAATWSLLPFAAFLLEPRGRWPVQRGSGVTKRVSLQLARSPRWTIALHFYGLRALLLVPALSATAWVFHESLPEPSRVATPVFQEEAIYLILFFWIPVLIAWSSRDGWLAEMRVYRSLPISGGRLVWHLLAPSAVALAIVALYLVSIRETMPEWRPVLGEAIALSAISTYISAKKAYENGEGGGFLILLFVIVIWLPAGMSPEITRILGPRVSAAMLDILVWSAVALGCWAPFYLRLVLANRSEPYKARGETHESRD